MSSAIGTGIYKRLAGLETMTGAGLAAQQALAALLATDPDTSAPAVHRGNKSEVAVYPAVTFRQNTGLIVPGFSTSGVAIDDTIFDFEIWDNTQRANILTDIYAQMERLLDGRFGLPPLTVDNSAGRVYWAKAFVPMAELYDRDLRAWFGLCRFRFVEARF